MVCGSGRSKSRLAKAAGAEPSGQMREEKLHAIAALSTCRSQNAQNTSASEHFLKLRCRKSARRCGAKYMWKSKCTKHTMFRPLFEVEMSKKCTPLWREAHLEVKVLKAPHVRTTIWSWEASKVHAVGAKNMSKSKCTKHLSFGALLEVEMSKECTPLWREAHLEVKVLKASHVRTTLDLRRSDVVSGGRRKGLCLLSNVSKTWRLCSCLDYTHHYTTLRSHYIPLHCTQLHYAALRCTALRSTALHDSTLQYTTTH